MLLSKHNLGKYTLHKILSFKKVGKTSNASYNITKLTSTLPLQNKFSKLLLKRKWHSGRSSTGRITIYSKGPRIKTKLPITNYNFRNSSLFFSAGSHYLGMSKKILSLIFSSTGIVSYIPARFNDKFFQLTKIKNFVYSQSQFYKELLYFKPFIQISTIPYMLIQQKKNSKVSFLELKPLKGIEYSRSLGCSSSIIKLDTRTGFSLVKLPSGIKKVFSAFSLAYEGPSNIPIFKNQLSSTKSGDWRRKGKKPCVRGVAMNPVDHPHGGRTKSLRYPRTPWGKTTKFK